MQGSQFTYQDIQVAAFSVSGRTQVSLRGVLEVAGFTRILDCSTINSLIETLDRQQIDLLLVDLDDEVDTVCEVLRQVRGGLVGPDPFITIIALISSPQRGIIKQAIEAGSDDVIGMPLTVNLLLEHTAKLVQARKGFVATTSYIGPDRRAPGREHPSDLPTITVPNALRHKSTGDAEVAADARSVKAFRQTVREHLVFRTAALINDEVLKHSWQLLDRKNAANRATEFQVLFERIRTVARLIDEAALAELVPLAAYMRTLVDSMLSSGKPKARVLSVIRLQCQAIMTSIKRDDGAGELIDAALERSAEVFVE